MTSDGDTKDDVRLPDGDVGAKITKLFKEEEKETRKLDLGSNCRSVTTAANTSH